MSEIFYLDVEDLLALTRALGAGPVRDIGLLDSAASRPPTSVLGEDAYPSLPLKAAALLHSVSANHALVDGNERLAWLAVVVFLDINGKRPGLDDEDAFDLVIEVASGLAAVEVIAERLRITDR